MKVSNKKISDRDRSYLNSQKTLQEFISDVDVNLTRFPIKDLLSKEEILRVCSECNVKVRIGKKDEILILSVRLQDREFIRKKLDKIVSLKLKSNIGGNTPVFKKQGCINNGDLFSIKLYIRTRVPKVMQTVEKYFYSTYNKDFFILDFICTPEKSDFKRGVEPNFNSLFLSRVMDYYDSEILDHIDYFRSISPGLDLAVIFAKIAPRSLKSDVKCDPKIHADLVYANELYCLKYIIENKKSIIFSKKMYIHYDFHKVWPECWNATITQLSKGQFNASKCYIKLPSTFRLDGQLCRSKRVLECSIILHSNGPTLVSQDDSVRNMIFYAVSKPEQECKDILTTLVIYIICHCIIMSSKLFGYKIDSRFWSDERIKQFDGMDLNDRDLAESGINIKRTLITPKKGPETVKFDINRCDKSQSFDFWSAVTTMYTTVKCIKRCSNRFKNIIQIDNILSSMLNVMDEFICNSVWYGWNVHLQSYTQNLNHDEYIYYDGYEVMAKQFRERLGYQEFVCTKIIKGSHNRIDVLDRIFNKNQTCRYVPSCFSDQHISCRCLNKELVYIDISLQKIEVNGVDQDKYVIKEEKDPLFLVSCLKDGKQPVLRFPGARFDDDVINSILEVYYKDFNSISSGILVMGDVDFAISRITTPEEEVILGFLSYQKSISLLSSYHTKYTGIHFEN